MQKKHFWLLSVLSGLLLTAAWPANGFAGLLFIAFVPLLFIENHLLEHKAESGKFRIFRWAFISFLIWNGLTTWWIWNATPLGGVFAVGLNAVFMAFVFNIFHIARRTLPSKANIWYLIFFWIGFEYLHHHWNPSWPWLSLGNGFATSIQWIQWYEFTGIFGGSLWIIMANILLFLAIKGRLAGGRTAKAFWVPALFFFLIVAIPMITSSLMFKNYKEVSKPVDVVVVQPNIDPWEEQYTLPVEETFRRNIGLAMKMTDSLTDFIVCPESALQESIWQNNLHSAQSIRLLDNFVDKHPWATIIIGASTFKYYEQGEKLSNTVRKFSNGTGYYDAYNTAFYVDTSHKYGMYHKSKLVPGPEKLPVPSLTRPLQELIFDLGGTVGSLAFAPERTVFHHCSKDLTIAIPICYESVYGEFISGFVNNGAELIFIITNDGWWGNTAGHRQHLSFSPLRAIETRRSIARSANTGISCFINQKGEITQSLPYLKSGVIRQKINANKKLTFYVRYGDYIGRIASFAAVLFLLLTIATGLINRRKKI
ncbi:MAG: apolipoprotein N-acyltransferase [Bacteroidales bacterium]|nr:apolipoprotein N-acyltransferase [Bacteroidales bacterium]